MTPRKSRTHASSSLSLGYDPDRFTSMKCEKLLEIHFRNKNTIQERGFLWDDAQLMEEFHRDMMALGWGRPRSMNLQTAQSSN